ncbi:MAG: alpha/beta hydrolase [Pseudomonadota bacterium]
MVKGGNDIKIAVQEWGNLEGKPILFAHAWSQSHLSWLPQINSNLAEKYHIITFDYRGHGNSEKPLEKDQYNNADIWADDLNAIINILELNDVTLVGWSYGSIVIADYLNKYGTDKVKALNIVGGITALGVKRVENHFGEDAAASMQAFDPKLPTQAIAMLNIAKMMVPDNLDKETYGFLIATNMMTPAFVRKAMTERSVDYKELYQQLDIPVLFTHGTQDTGILPIAAIEAADFVQKSKLSLYEGANHGPHWFDAKRFNFELAKLVNAY